MKLKFQILAIAALTSKALAFPSKMFDMSMSPEETRAIADIVQTIEAGTIINRDGPILSPGFSASEQYVSTTGDHAFVPPSSTDLRGPCPGLNAMANHGYIPHVGVATITQFIQGTFDVFGMGLDLGAFLSVYGAIFDGDLVSWSIGGAPSPGLLTSIASSIGLLGTPEGITGSHNKYEADVSPTRGDLYEYGNNDKLVLDQFKELYSQPLGPNGYDLTALTPFRASRFQQSIENNPYFFNGPLTGVVVQPAAYTFIYRFMANKSSTYPEGYLDGEVLKSFYSITGDTPDDFVWTEGYERIPDNWYKRAIGDEYTITSFDLDLVSMALQYPQFLSIGGNTGTVNSFTGVDIENLTDGAYNLETFTQGDNAICFAYQFSQQAAPDLLKGIFSNLVQPLSQLNTALGNVFSELSCPQLQSIDTSQFQNYPGATGAY